MKMLLLMFLVILISSINVLAFGANTHVDIDKDLIWTKDSNDDYVEKGIIAQLIRNNWDACLVGIEYPDKYIFDYFSTFQLYAESHDYNTWDRALNDCARNDRDRAWAYCAKLHLAQDTISHNNYIPTKQRKTKLPNWAIHAPSEFALDGLHIQEETSRIMEKHAEFDSVYECASGRPDEGRAERLNQVLGGNSFYQEAYVTQGTTTFAKLQRGLYIVLSKTPLVDKDRSIDYVNLAISNSRQILAGTNPPQDPSGEKILGAGDKTSNFYLYPITIIGLLILFGFSIKRRWIYLPWRD